jgi:hypothetical protein
VPGVPEMRTACVPRCVPPASAVPTVRLPGVVSLEDFDRYVEEHGIPEEDYPAAFARWIAEVTGGPVPRFEKWNASRRRTAS